MNYIFFLSGAAIALFSLFVAAVQIAHGLSIEQTHAAYNAVSQTAREHALKAVESAEKWIGLYNFLSILCLFFAMWLHTSVSFILLMSVIFIYAYEAMMSIAQGKDYDSVRKNVLFSRYFLAQKKPSHWRTACYMLAFVLCGILFAYDPYFLNLESFFNIPTYD